jgi:hypothetical protein
MSERNNDTAVLTAQIGRPPRSEAVVSARCHLGLPVVTQVPPVLDTGEPFPTRYWLGCPLAQRRISRIEAAGGVRDFALEAEQDPVFRGELEAAHERYARARDAEIPEDARLRPSGGVGGARRGVKCLHAHYADHAAGNLNPVGARVAEQVEPLNCKAPCVLVEAEPASRNPEWREPGAEET